MRPCTSGRTTGLWTSLFIGLLALPLCAVLLLALIQSTIRADDQWNPGERLLSSEADSAVFDSQPLEIEFDQEGQLLYLSDSSGDFFADDRNAIGRPLEISFVFTSDDGEIVSVTIDQDAVVCNADDCACLSIREDGILDVMPIHHKFAIDFIQRPRKRCH